MRNLNYTGNHLLRFSILAVSAYILSFPGCAKEPDWKAINDKIIKEHNIEGRIRNDIPETGIISNLAPGVVSSIKNLPVAEIALGVKARMYWGNGTLIAWMILEPGAEIPREILPGERFMFVRRGSVEQLINGSFVTMRAFEREEPDGIHGGTPKAEFVFLENGTENEVKTGKEGAEILEVYWPVRLEIFLWGIFLLSLLLCQIKCMICMMCSLPS
jgi:gluconolactonase